jgi:hypothetical protein
MAHIRYVFTIGRVAEILGEDEDWLHDLSIDMFPDRYEASDQKQDATGS